MNRIEATGLTKIPLGRQGENLARQISFDVSGWASEYGPGVAELIFQRSRSEAPYPVKTERDGNKVIWSVTASDTYTPGDNGKCELRYYVDKVLVKSCIWKVGVDRAMDTPSGTAPPYPERGWVDQVVSAGAEAKQAAERAENAVVHAPIIGDNGNWFVWDSTTAEYIDTGRYSGGSAPYIGANGNWFIGTEDSGVSATGPAGPAGRDGRDGVDGQPGRDGVDGLPGEKGDPFRYEDFTKEQLEALRGPEGPAGQPGRDGVDGKDGRDGYTPQKGVDYFDGEPGQPGEKGDPFTYDDFTPEQLEALRGPQGIPGLAGSDATVTAENIQSALGYTPADSEDVSTKLDKPTTSPEVGNILKVTAVNEDGSFVCEWADALSGGVSDVQINGTSAVADGVANIPCADKYGAFPGVVAISPARGLDYYGNTKILTVMSAVEKNIKNRNKDKVFLHPLILDYAVKAAMCDGVGAAWTDAERLAALLRMGCTVDDNGIVHWTAQ